MENIQTSSRPFNRFAIPVKWGIILALVYCILATVLNVFLIEKFVAYSLLWLVMYLVFVVFYCVAGIQQRKAMGGYIDFKSAFQAIFIVIIISASIGEIWDYVYANFIDPQLIDKMKVAIVSFMEWSNAPQDSIDEKLAEFDAPRGFGDIFLGLCKKVIGLSILGFICAAIVKKKKPEFGAA